MKRLILGLALLAFRPGYQPAALAQDRPGANPHGPMPQGMDCSACHTASGWRPLRSPLLFDHGKTSFPLTGRHAQVTCERCHQGLRFDLPGPGTTACAACHADVHQGQIAGQCERCHSADSFQNVPAVALHARVGFALTGAHLQAPCESCHRNDQGGAFAPMSQDCISCHREQYTGTTMPDHAAAGFPANCEQCHSSLTWTGGVAFDHAAAANGYALVGAHALLRCASCHTAPAFALIYTPANQNDCIACHTQQYQRAHGTAGFPTTCLDCHSQNSWSGATFDHSKWFPLRNAHDVSCNRCHITPGDYTTFDCLTCHGQSETNSRHADVSGYSYDSAACYRCHANGRGGG
jgi:hypothetical protein